MKMLFIKHDHTVPITTTIGEIKTKISRFDRESYADISVVDDNGRLHSVLKPQS